MEPTHTADHDQFDTEFLPSGTTLLNGQYVIERYLSNGGFGITYLAHDSLDRRVVIKECFPEAFCSRKNASVMARSRSHQGEFRSFVDMFVREAHSIAKLSHPNIVGVHQVFRDNETAYMALDLIEGEDLFDLIEATSKRPSYQEVKPILLKILDAISAIHERDMLHRDISPDNILIDAWGEPTLIDFGAAREEASKKSRALSAVLVVKDGYSPQEFYISGSQQAPSSDLYALAATFFHFISRKPPPNSQTRLAAIASNKADPYEPLKDRIEGYPNAFLEAIDMAMSVFPQDRIQSAQDWILKIDEEKRRAVFLKNAQSEQQIKETVMQLMENAKNEQETAIADEIIKCTPQPKDNPISAKNVASADDIDGMFVRHDPQETDDKINNTEIFDPDSSYQQEEMQIADVGKPDSWATARVIFCVSLGLLFIDWNISELLELIIPFVEQMISLTQENFSSVAKV